jgi:hypothetical protein
MSLEAISIAHDTRQSLFFESFRNRDRLFTVSESDFSFTAEQLRNIHESSFASLLFHRLIDAAYFAGQESFRTGKNDSASMFYQAIQRSLPVSSRFFLEKRTNKFPLFSRDDLLWTKNPEGIQTVEFKIAESEGGKLTGFGSVPVFENLRNARNMSADRLPGIIPLIAQGLLHENAMLGNQDSPILLILSSKDDFHRAEYAAFVSALRQHSVPCYFVEEHQLTDEMLTPSGILLPHQDRASRLLINFPNAERIAEGGSIELTPIRKKLLQLYQDDVISFALPPQPHVGLKIARALVWSSDQEMTAFLSLLAGGRANLEYIRSFIPRSFIVNGQEQEEELRNMFIKRVGKSGEGGVIGPGENNRDKRKQIIEEAKRNPDTFVAEEMIETKKIAIPESSAELYVRISALKYNSADETQLGSILMTGRLVPHVHAAKDSFMWAGSGGVVSEERKPTMYHLPKNREEVQSLFYTMSEAPLSKNIVWNHILVLSREFSVGRTSDGIFNLVHPHILEQFRSKPDAPDVRRLKTALREMIQAVEYVKKAGVFFEQSEHTNQCVLSVSEQEAVKRVLYWWLSIQEYSTVRNNIGHRPDENSQLLARILTNEIHGRPTQIATIICPGYSSAHESGLSEKIDEQKSSGIHNQLRLFTQGIAFPNFSLHVLFGGKFEILPQFVEFNKVFLDQVLDTEYQKLQSFFGTIGEVELLERYINQDRYISVRNDIFSYLSTLKEYGNRLAYCRKTIINGPLYKNMESVGKPIVDIDYHVQYFDAVYAAIAISLGEQGFTCLFNTEGPIRRWGYLFPHRSKISRYQSAVREIWAAGDNQMHWI